MENLISCKISLEDLKILYEKFCVDPDLDHHDCDRCVLRTIRTTHLKKWPPAQEGDENTAKRDLCFIIWHDDILNLPGNKP